MKALSLHQPWASLVAEGVKTIETRQWKTSYRGPLAIHGARHPNHWVMHNGRRSCRGCRHEYWERLVPPLPMGAVVATCTLVDVVPMVSGDYDGSASPHLYLGEPAGNIVLFERVDGPWGRWKTTDLTDQKAFGDYSEDRFAWLLADIVKLDPPVPARGRQQLWNWDAEQVPA